MIAVAGPIPAGPKAASTTGTPIIRVLPKAQLRAKSPDSASPRPAASREKASAPA